MRAAGFSLALFATIIFAAAAVAADQNPPTKMEAPPPPGINDPGVTTPKQAAGKADEQKPAAAERGDTDPLSPLPKPDTRLVRDKASRTSEATSERIAASDVTTRKEGGDTVEEYRQHGRLWMIRIHKVNGPVQTFITAGNGRLTRDPKEGPVSPVYYTLYEWN